MNVSTIRTTFAANPLPSGRALPPTKADKPYVAASDPNFPKSVDMHNLTLNEINALIKSGVDGLLDILPAIPSPISGEYSGDVMNLKTDYIGTIEGHIAFKKSIGEDTAFLQKVLERVKRLDGSKLPSTINERV